MDASGLEVITRYMQRRVKTRQSSVTSCEGTFVNRQNFECHRNLTSVEHLCANFCYRHILVSSESTVSLTDNECVPDDEEFDTNEVLDLYWMKFTKKVLKMHDIYKLIMSSNELI